MRVIEVYPGDMKASTGVEALPLKLWRFTPKVMEVYPGVIEAYPQVM